MQQPKEQTVETEIDQIEPAVSICPAGEVFPLPAEQEYEEEFKKLQKIVK